MIEQELINHNNLHEKSHRSDFRIKNSACSRENNYDNGIKYSTQLNSEYRAGTRKGERSDVQESHSQNIYSGLDASNCTSQNLSCNLNQS